MLVVNVMYGHNYNNNDVIYDLEWSGITDDRY